LQCNTPDTSIAKRVQPSTPRLPHRRWIGTVYMALARMGAVFPKDTGEGWAWAGPDPMQAIGLDRFVKVCACVCVCMRVCVCEERDCMSVCVYMCMCLCVCLIACVPRLGGVCA